MVQLRGISGFTKKEAKLSQTASLLCLLGLAHRAKLDDNARLLDFTQKLEAACIDTVESGKMTKDLALIIHGSKLTRDKYLNTEEFIDAVAAELNW